MFRQEMISVLGTVVLGAFLACGPAASEGAVTIQAAEGDETVRLAIESALSGIGSLISASSGEKEVEVRYDAGGATYHVRSDDGSTVTIDARSGKYTVHARNPERVSATVERSLDGVGAVLRAAHLSRAGSTRGVEPALSEAEREALISVWRAQGLARDRVDAYAEILTNVEAIENYAQRLERDAGDLERTIEADARAIEREAERIEREANRIERDAAELERQIEADARAIERAAERRLEEAGGVSTESEAVFSCRDDELILEGRTIETPGIAIVASGNCSVLIVSCEISSGSFAIRVSGNADVEIRDSRIEGLTAAIELGGNATVEASGTDFIGRVITTGNAELEDLGGNTFHRK